MYEQRPLKNKVSVSIDSDIEKAIKELSQLDDRSFSQYINRVLRKHLETIGYVPEPNDDK